MRHFILKTYGKMILGKVCFILLSSAFLAQCFAEQDLKIEVTRKADDCERVTEEKDLLYVHYTSYFENGTKIESSYDRGQPMYFPLGRGKIIKGLDDALIGMCIGEIRRITVPPHLAYGSEGYKTDIAEIPPDTTLVFEAELVLFNDQSAVHQAFTTLDTDNNDLLDEDEIRVMMGSFQYLPKNIFPEQPDDQRLEEMFKEMFTQADLNGDSYISLDEFLIVTALQEPPKPKDGAQTQAEPEAKNDDKNDEAKPKAKIPAKEL